jgi:hypothetical protein
MKFAIVVLFAVLLLTSACGTSSEGGKGGPPLKETVKLVPNQEVAVKDTNLKLTLKEVAPGPPPAVTIDVKLNTMEVLRTLKVGEYLELGEFKVTLTSVDPSGKPNCEVQVLRQ